MSSLQNEPPDETPGAASAPRPKILLIAYPELADPTARYLRRIGWDVTVPVLPTQTAEGCAALLFPPKDLTMPKREHRLRLLRWKRESEEPITVDAGPPAFFAWNAFDAVVIQDLWFSSTEQRLIPFGCTVVNTDYYVRGNFDQPKVVLVTDPAFYGWPQFSTIPTEEVLRNAFDRNGQIEFVPVIGMDRSNRSLARVAAAIRHLPVNQRPKRRRGAKAVNAPEQGRGMAVLSAALARYVSSRAHVIVVDDASKAIRRVAGCFQEVIDDLPEGKLHLCDLGSGEVSSYDSFDDVSRHCERVIDEARRSNQLLLFVTDILFDAVDWDAGRKTGIDLIDVLRRLQREQHTKLGVVSLTGVASAEIVQSAVQLGADLVVSKAPSDTSSIHHANEVNDQVLYKLMLALGFLCFQYELLRAKRHVAASRAREESDAMKRILPPHSASQHLHAEWNSTQYLLESQATYAHTSSLQVERAIRRIREQYD